MTEFDARDSFQLERGGEREIDGHVNACVVNDSGLSG
jgi:hypothetical protein